MNIQNIHCVAYRTALRKYESIKPIRGKPHIRPIDDRRKQYQTIEFDEATKEVHMVLYSTKVVTYKPDGTITLRTGGWVTPSTAAFMHRWAPVGVRKVKNNLWSIYRGEAWPICPTLELGAGFEPVGQIVLPVWHINKEKSKYASEVVRPFLHYARDMIRIGGGSLRLGDVPKDCWSCVEDFQDEERWTGFLAYLYDRDWNPPWSDDSIDVYAKLRSKLYSQVVAKYARVTKPTLIDGRKYYDLAT